MALIGGAVESRRIHARWRRERRVEAYLDVYKLELVTETAIATGTKGSDFSRREIADRTAAIVFIGPDNVGLAVRTPSPSPAEDSLQAVSDAIEFGWPEGVPELAVDRGQIDGGRLTEPAPALVGEQGVGAPAVVGVRRSSH